MKTTIFLSILMALLVLLFSYTAIFKIIDHHNFLIQLSVSPLRSVKRFAALISWAIPIVELLIVTMILFKETRSAGLWSSLVMLLVFETYVAGLFFSGSRLPCSCGGVISSMSWPQHIVFNAVYIAISLTAIVLSRVAGRANIKDLSRA